MVGVGAGKDGVSSGVGVSPLLGEVCKQQLDDPRKEVSVLNRCLGPSL